MSNYLSKTLLILISFFCFIVFSSLGLYWTSYPYDAWRIYEIIILITFTFYSSYHFHINKNSIFKNNLTHQQYFFFLIIIVLFCVCTISFAEIPERAISEASLYFLLINFTLICSQIIRNNPIFSQKITTSIAFFPLLTLIFLPIALFDRFQGGDGVWTQSFTNIRMLDDALLACLFLLWLQPTYLNLNHDNSSFRKLLMTCTVYIVSIIYLLSFLFHGARACLLGISIGLILGILLSSKSERHFFKLPLISISIAIIIFNIYNIFLSTNIGSSIARTDSSGRIELWQKSLQIWFDNPLLGIGGNHFPLQHPMLLPSHPHNIFFKLLAEWGIVTFFILFLFYMIVKKVYRHKTNIPILLLSGLFAIIFNTLLSGSLIYPVSQFINFWFFALIVSFLPVYKMTKINSYFNYQKKLWIFVSIFSLIAILYVHGQDILCHPCISIDEYGAPNFWDQGRAIHLSPISDLKNSPNTQ